LKAAVLETAEYRKSRDVDLEFLTLQIHVHDTAESLYKSIGMDVLPDEYLPDDYTGPSAGSIQQIIRTYRLQSL